jgi:hypothetical protein
VWPGLFLLSDVFQATLAGVPFALGALRFAAIEFAEGVFGGGFLDKRVLEAQPKVKKRVDPMLAILRGQGNFPLRCGRGIRSKSYRPQRDRRTSREDSDMGGLHPLASQGLIFDFVAGKDFPLSLQTLDRGTQPVSHRFLQFALPPVSARGIQSLSHRTERDMPVGLSQYGARAAPVHQYARAAWGSILLAVIIHAGMGIFENKFRAPVRPCRRVVSTLF